MRVKKEATHIFCLFFEKHPFRPVSRPISSRLFTKIPTRPHHILHLSPLRYTHLTKLGTLLISSGRVDTNHIPEMPLKLRLLHTGKNRRLTEVTANAVLSEARYAFLLDDDKIVQG